MERRLDKSYSKTKSSEKGDESKSGTTEFDEKRLEITLETIKDFNPNNIEGEHSDSTLLAVKNPTSFAFASYETGLYIIEQEDLIYSENLRRGVCPLQDLIYIDHLNCYILHYNNKIYRQDTDNWAPYFYMDIPCSYNITRLFRYSKINQRLIAPWGDDHLCVMNLERKQAEMVLKREHYLDLRLFGAKEDRIACLNSSGLISLYLINLDLKKICQKFSYQIQFEEKTDQFVLIGNL